MARSQKTRQKSLERKAAKRKQRKQTTPQVLPPSSHSLPQAAAEWPLYECLVSRGWNQQGELAQIFVSRRGPAAQIAAAAILVDLECLGVKSAVARLFRTPEGYEEMRNTIMMQEEMVSAKLNLVAKIIQEGIAYAQRLGFHPDREYRTAAILLADADPDACAVRVPLGRNGRPFFVAGPYDDARRIIAQLEKAVGPGNFDCLVPLAELF